MGSSALRGHLSDLAVLSAVLLLGFGALGSTMKNGVVAIVEPRIETDGPSYSVSIQGRKFESTKELLDGLGDGAGSTLMLLVREDTSIEDITEIASLALKAGYRRDAIHLFVFDEERAEVVAIPGYRYAGYSESPESLSRLVTSQESRE